MSDLKVTICILGSRPHWSRRRGFENDQIRPLYINQIIKLTIESIPFLLELALLLVAFGLLTSQRVVILNPPLAMYTQSMK